MDDPGQRARDARQGAEDAYYRASLAHDRARDLHEAAARFHDAHAAQARLLGDTQLARLAEERAAADRTKARREAAAAQLHRQGLGDPL